MIVLLVRLWCNPSEISSKWGNWRIKFYGSPMLKRRNWISSFYCQLETDWLLENVTLIQIQWQQCLIGELQNNKIYKYARWFNWNQLIVSILNSEYRNLYIHCMSSSQRPLLYSEWKRELGNGLRSISPKRSQRNEKMFHNILNPRHFYFAW